MLCFPISHNIGLSELPEWTVVGFTCEFPHFRIDIVSWESELYKKHLCFPPLYCVFDSKGERKTMLVIWSNLSYGNRKNFSACTSPPMLLKCDARTEVYGLHVTILETKTENFKNSVKTLNENSQAVQTKARSLRAFWRILIKKKRYFTLQSRCVRKQQQICNLRIRGLIGQKAAPMAPTRKLCFLQSRVLLLAGLPENTLIFLPHVVIFLRYFEKALVRHINKILPLLCEIMKWVLSSWILI